MIKILVSFCFIFSFFNLQAHQYFPPDYHRTTYTIVDTKIGWWTGEIRLNNGSKWYSPEPSELKKWQAGEHLIASYHSHGSTYIEKLLWIRLYNIERDEAADVSFIGQGEMEINELTSLIQDVDFQKGIILFNNGERAEIKDYPNSYTFLSGIDQAIKFWKIGTPAMILLSPRSSETNDEYVLFNIDRAKNSFPIAYLRFLSDSR